MMKVEEKDGKLTAPLLRGVPPAEAAGAEGTAGFIKSKRSPTKASERSEGDGIPTRSETENCSTQRAKMVSPAVKRLAAINHGMYSFNSPLRTATLYLIGVSVFWSDSKRMASFLLGVFFPDLVDPGGSLGMQLKFKILTGLGTILGSLLAAIGYEYGKYLVVPFAAVVSFGAGMCLGLSPAEFFAGKLTVAVFAVYMGVEPHPIGETVAYTSIGVACAIAFTILAELPGSYDGLRSDLFKMYNSLGHGLLSSTKDIKNLHKVGLIMPAGRITETRRRIEMYCRPDHRLEKMRGLVHSADRTRVAFVSLLAAKDVGIDEVVLFKDAVGRAALQIAGLCEFSLLQRTPCLQRRARAAVDAVDEAAVNATDAIKRDDRVDCEEQVRLIASIQQSIRSAATAVVDSPWPLGTRWDWSQLCSDMRISPFTRSFNMWVYTWRFTIAVTLACVPYIWLSDKHSNWFPMTIAFISLAGFGASLGKIAQRMIGTFLGLALGSFLFWANEYRALVTILFAAVVFAARVFFLANYGLFTMFITGFVYLILTHQGVPLAETTAYRLGWTVAAEALWAASMFVYRPPFADEIGAKLAAHANAINEYCQEIVSQKNDLDGIERGEESPTSRYETDATRAKRAAVMGAVVAADAAIAEACLAPRPKGYFRINPHLLAPAINLELLVAASIALTRTEQMISRDANDGLLAEILDEETLSLLNRLASRLEGTAESETIECLEQDREGNRFKAAIVQAHNMLTNA